MTNEELIARLRQPFRSGEPVNDLCIEAADRIAALTADLERACAFSRSAMEAGFQASQRALKAEAERDANAKDAERYRFVRDNIDRLTSDENGIAGVAYSCQISLADIEQHSPALLLDMIADAVLCEDK